MACVATSEAGSSHGLGGILTDGLVRSCSILTRGFFFPPTTLNIPFVLGSCMKIIRLPVLAASFTAMKFRCLRLPDIEALDSIIEAILFGRRGNFVLGRAPSPSPAENDVGIATPCFPVFTSIPPCSWVSMYGAIDPVAELWALILRVFDCSTWIDCIVNLLRWIIDFEAFALAAFWALNAMPLIVALVANGIALDLAIFN